MPCSVRPRNIPCPEPGCGRFFANQSGLTLHGRAHDARARLQQQRQQPAANSGVNNGPSSSDVDGDDPNHFDIDGDEPHNFDINGDNSSPPNTPRHLPNNLNKGEEVRIHPLINGISSYLSLYILI